MSSPGAPSSFAAAPAPPTPPDAIHATGALRSDDIVHYHNYVRLHQRLLLTSIMYGSIIALGLLMALNEDLPLWLGFLLGVLGAFCGHIVNQMVSLSQARRAVAAQANQKPAQIVLSRDGIRETTHVSSSNYDWRTVTRISRSRHAIYLDMGHIAMILPRGFFAGLSLEQVESRLQQWWRPEHMRPPLPSPGTL